ncbi:DNA excision repair protein ERCC-6 2, partial [Biomphalaria glabrata]
SQVNTQESHSSNLFMPLHGQEDLSRLREKFKYDSDSSDNEKALMSLGRVSQWKPINSTQWLSSHSPLKKSSAGVRTRRNKPKVGCTLKVSSSGASITKSSPVTGYKEHEELKMDSRSETRNQSSSSCVMITDCPTVLNNGRVANDVDLGNQEDDFWDGFSLAETEKPKLSVPPLSPKVNFQLDSQVAVPAPTNQYLRDYQREGIQFLYQHYINRTGAILADDMGLGKTIQVIGFLSAVLRKQGNKNDTLKMIPKFIKKLSGHLTDSPPNRKCKPFLIIGPSAVVYNWLDELNTWGYFIVRKFHGSDKDVCLSDLKKGKLEIVVTTFETYRDNLVSLNQIEWEAIFVDEVHKIKGVKSQVTLALKEINTPCRFGLTGTVLQNNLTELWSLLDWAQPGVLGTLPQFENDFIDVIELGQRQDATKRELAQARKQKDKFAKIRKTLMLRRTKALIADQLPSKDDMVVLCKLTDFQVSIYKAILGHPDMYLILHSDEPCDCDSGKSRASCCYKRASDGTKIWSMIFSFMHLLLKAANHIALLIPNNNKLNDKQARLAKSVCELAFRDHPHFVEQTSTASFRTLSDAKYCGKIKILEGLLSVFEQNHDKVLIFSYSTKLLDILEQYIIAKGHEYRRIDGKVSSLCRRNIVIQFNKDPNLFLCLISTKAGGLGLNMTAANRVIIFDPNWNPSHDLQAQDRAYRLGQCRDVQVFRLVSAGTIEENIYLRQIYKQQLDEVVIGTGNARRYFNGIQGDKENPGELFGIKNMFSLRPENSSLTLDIFKRNEKIEKALAGYDITKYIPSKEELSQQQEEDSDDTEVEEISFDSEAEKKEEELFYKNLFGSRDTSTFQTSPVKASIPETSPGKQGSVDLVADESDEEFSLIPKLHSTKVTPARSTEQRSLQALSGHHDLLSKQSKCPETSVPVSHKIICKQAADVDYSTNHDEDLKLDQSSTRNPLRIHTGLQDPTRSSRSTSKIKTVAKKPMSGSSKEGKQKFTSIKSVLKKNGALHTLKNNQVVGSSRAEDHMTRCAIEDVFLKHINTQVPAVQCEPYSQHEEEEPKKRSRKKNKVTKETKPDLNRKRTIQNGHVTVIVGQTPNAILRQQWSMLCKSRGVESHELARYILQSTQQDRLKILHEFYQQQFPDLEDTVSELYKTETKDGEIENKTNYLSDKNKTSHQEGSSLIDSTQEMPAMLLDMSTLASDSQGPLPQPAAQESVGASVAVNTKGRQSKALTGSQTRKGKGRATQSASNHGNKHKSSFVKETCLHAAMDVSENPAGKQIAVRASDSKVSEDTLTKQSCDDPFPHTFQKSRNSEKTLNKQRCNVAKVLDDIFQSSDDESEKETSFDEKMNQHLASPGKDTKSISHLNDSCHSLDFLSKHSQENEFEFLIQRKCKSKNKEEYNSATKKKETNLPLLHLNDSCSSLDFLSKNSQGTDASKRTCKTKSFEKHESCDIKKLKTSLQRTESYLDVDDLDDFNFDKMTATPLDGSESLF